MARRTPPNEANDVVAREMLRGFVGEIEASDDRIAAENKHKSAIYKRAKDKGFNVKALRKVIAARRMDEVDRNKLEGDFDLYWITVADLAHAHVENIEEIDPETGEILDTNTARETLASTTAADPAGEADDASSADPSTAPRSDVGDNSTEASGPGQRLDPAAATTPPAGEAPPVDTNFDPGTGAGSDTAVAEGGQPQHVIADAPAGTAVSEKVEAERKDQNALVPSSDGGPIPGAAGSIAPRTNSEPEGASGGEMPRMASGEGTGPQPSSVVPGRQPGCLNPDTCAGTWRKRCATCERAFMAVAAGGQAIVHQGAVS